MATTSSQDTKLKLVFAYLVVSAASIREIPFLEQWGVDFQNLYAFERCSQGRVPYVVSGATCGDVQRRDMVYPPFLFHSFAWIRGMTFTSAMSVWAAVTLFSLAAIYYAWVRWIAPADARERPGEVVIFCALLALQFPFVFLLERGGTDIVPLVLWTATSYFCCKRKFALAGVLGGTATAFKIYPAIPCAIVALALLVGGWRRTSFKRTDFLRFGAGALASLVVINLFFLRDARIYFTTTLPKFAEVITVAVVFSHSLPSFSGEQHALFWKLPALMLLALWSWAAWRSLATRPAMTLAGVLAISTYFSGVSWDYNLVTTFPLLLLSFLEARRINRWLSLSLGLVAIVGDRNLFTSNWLGVLTPETHLALQLAWLVVAAFEVAQPLAQQPATAVPATTV